MYLLWARVFLTYRFIEKMCSSSILYAMSLSFCWVVKAGHLVLIWYFSPQCWCCYLQNISQFSFFSMCIVITFVQVIITFLISCFFQPSMYLHWSFKNINLTVSPFYLKFFSGEIYNFNMTSKELACAALPLPFSIIFLIFPVCGTMMCTVLLQ